MQKLKPHKLFKYDFDEMLKHGPEQEKKHLANAGENLIIIDLHKFFDNDVLSLIISNDFVYNAALKFARDFTPDIFDSIKLNKQEINTAQQRLSDTNEKVIRFLVSAHRDGVAPDVGNSALVKASDFTSLLRIDLLTEVRKEEAHHLLKETRDQEILHLKTILRNIRELYEGALPRIMFVVKCAIKVMLDLPPSQSDRELLGISNQLTWFESHIDSNHPLNVIFKDMRKLYKVARNVESHHKGLIWIPNSNKIILKDRNTETVLDLHEFQQSYRYLVYVCEFGLRGILSAFAQRERSSVSNKLVSQYDSTFQNEFPDRKDLIDYY